MDSLASAVNPLASPEELEQIVKLREHFAEELGKREQEDRYHLAFFGDIKLTRVLRGNDGDLDKAIVWYGEFLKMFNELELDKRLPNLNVDVTKGGVIDRWAAPGSKVKEYMGMVWNAEKLTPNGDVVCYVPMSDTFVEGIVSNDLFGEIKEYWCSDCLLRDLHLDHLSRMQNRVTKMVLIIDMTDACMKQVFSMKFFDYDKKVLTPIKKSLPIECVHITIIANAPRWFNTLWNRLFRKMCAEHFARRVVFLGSDWTSNRLLTRYIGADQLATLLATRKFKGENEDEAGDENRGTRAINAGSTFERVFQAKVGEQYSWDFEVEQGRLTSSGLDVEFSVILLCDEDEKDCCNDANIEEEFLHSPTMVKASDGQVSGSCNVKHSGMLIVRWSNSHSWLRGKTIKFAVEVKSDESDAAVSRCAGA